MCGRFTDMLAQLDLEDDLAVDLWLSTVRRPHYNVAPSQQIRLITDLNNPADLFEIKVPQHEGPARTAFDARWGLVPHWSKTGPSAGGLINARSETVTTKPSFRGAARYRRAVVPASGYFEWVKQPDGSKQAFYLSPDDGAPLYFAGLYEKWGPDSILTATILTREAPDHLAVIHPRTPVVLARDLVDAWLEPDLTEVGAVEGILASAQQRELHAVAVGPQVGSVRNNGPELIAPTELNSLW